MYARYETCVVTRTIAGWHCRRPARWRRSPSLVSLRLHSFDGCFDERRHRMWLRHVDGVTARYLDDGRTCALGHETLGRRWDHLVVDGDQVPARPGLPRWLTDRAALRFHAPRDLGI